MAAGKGLEGVIASTTELSFIDGEAGVLVYRGYDIHEIAETIGFEECAHLLWHGDLPTRAQLDDLKSRLVAERELPGPVVDTLKSLVGRATPMEALRTAVSALSAFDPDAECPASDAEANQRKAVRITARMAMIVTAFHRLREGKDIVPADGSLGHAANFLYTLNGEKPTETAVKTFDICLNLHADHGFNASTFATRVTVGTLSDLYSGVTSGIGTLKGPLHGGANERVMATLETVGGPDNARQFVLDALARKEKIMGFGHRVYRTEDPRATHLRKISEVLCAETGNEDLYEMSRIMEQTMIGEKGINPNVDFYSATVYHALGFPRDIYTPIFACSRSVGWTAHAIEQLIDNRLIRPRAEYVGKKHLKFKPLAERE